jgi:hypothetical protein
MQRWPIGTLHAAARSLAALLLVLQAAGGGAVALAHASDSVGGPATFESHHTAHCVTLHDAARCAQCQYQASRVVPAARRRLPLAAGATRYQPNRDRARLAPPRLHPRAAPPRAPPQSPA